MSASARVAEKRTATARGSQRPPQARATSRQLGVTSVLFAQGTYVGNGTSQSIIGVGFAPKIVFVHADPDTEPVSAQRNGMMRTTTMSVARNVQNTTTNQGISSLGLDGFSVSTVVAVNGKTNESGVTYFYQAFGGASCAVGSYTGNGGASQAITGVGFRPDVLCVATLVQFPGLVLRQSTLAPGERDLPTTTINGLLDRLRTLDADGFTVGNEGGDLNTLGDICHYWALKAAGNLALGSYPGINAPQTVPSVPFGFTPAAVWVKNPAVGASMSAVFKTSSMSVGDALLWGPEATQTNEILALLAGQFNLSKPDITSSSNHYQVGVHHFFALDNSVGSFTRPMNHNVGATLDARPPVGKPSVADTLKASASLPLAKTAYARNPVRPPIAGAASQPPNKTSAGKVKLPTRPPIGKGNK